MSLELGLAIAAALLAAAGAAFAWRLGRRLAELDGRICEAAARGQALSDRIEALNRLEERQRVTEQAIETSTSVVREVHMGIADIPFGILEAIPGTRQPTKAVREIHDRITEGVYGALSGLNKAVGRELRRGLREGTGTDSNIAERSADPAPDSTPQSSDRTP